MGPKPDLSVSIVNYNSTDYLIRCLTSIKHHSEGLKTEILIVDNGSSDFEAGKVHQVFPEAVISVNKKNEGFAYAQNQNFALSTADYFLLLNPDTMVTQGTLHAIIEAFQRCHNVSVVAPNLVSPEGRSLVNVRDFPTLKSASKELLYLNRVVPRNNLQNSSFDKIEFQYVNCITGAAFAVRSRVYRALGGLDEAFFMYFEEVDFCRRMTRILHQKIVLLTHVNVFHFLGRSSIQTDVRQTVYYQSYYLYFKKHHGTRYSLLFRVLVCLSMIMKLIGIQVKYFPLRTGWTLYVNKLAISWRMFLWGLGIQIPQRNFTR